MNEEDKLPFSASQLQRETGEHDSDTELEIPETESSDEDADDPFGFDGVQQQASSLRNPFVPPKLIQPSPEPRREESHYKEWREIEAGHRSLPKRRRVLPLSLADHVLDSRLGEPELIDDTM